MVLDEIDPELTATLMGKRNERKAGVPTTRKRRNAARNRADYGGRPFIAWDSEGWSDQLGRHHTCLFGASTGEYRKGPRLTTRQMLDLIVRTGQAHPKAIHVAFSFGYDVNMILESLEPRQLFQLKKRNTVHWRGYRIEHIPGKWLEVSRTAMEPDGKRRSVPGTSVRIMDVFSFFTTSFVAALRSWNVGTPEAIARIEVGKDGRGSFRLSELESIQRYWREELELLVGLCGRLRDVLASADIHPRSWHGPGAVASVLLRKHDIKSVLDKGLPAAVLDASAFAYAGGRFETFRAGMVDGPVYSADINSAYPYILSTLPNLATGHWTHLKADSDDPKDMAEALRGRRMALVRLSVAYGRDEQHAADFEGSPHRLFHRDTRGLISFPGAVSGWYHLPEAMLILNEDVANSAQIYRVHEAWIFEDDGSYPFEWIRDLYEQRRIWKADGNPAERAAKLGYNSIYGKLAQRVGGRDDAPPWHQLEYAGAITSGARAMLYSAMASVGEGLIAGETDGVYSTQPFGGLANGKGDGLGQWEVDRYDGVFYVQSGVYWLRKGDKWLPPKSRGIPAKSLAFGSALAAYGNGRSLRGAHTTFVGYGRALAGQFRNWRRWVESEKEFQFGGGGKRIHSKRCRACSMDVGLTEGLHELYPKQTNPEPVETGKWMSWESQPHYLPWRDTPSYPEMEEHAELQKWIKDGYHD